MLKASGGEQAVHPVSDLQPQRLVLILAVFLIQSRSACMRFCQVIAQSLVQANGLWANTSLHIGDHRCESETVEYGRNKPQSMAVHQVWLCVL